MYDIFSLTLLKSETSAYSTSRKNYIRNKIRQILAMKWSLDSFFHPLGYFLGHLGDSITSSEFESRVILWPSQRPKKRQRNSRAEWITPAMFKWCCKPSNCLKLWSTWLFKNFRQNILSHAISFFFVPASAYYAPVRAYDYLIIWTSENRSQFDTSDQSMASTSIGVRT